MDKKERKPDLCVLCGCETGYYFDTPVDEREYFVTGVGQLCKKCNAKIELMKLLDASGKSDCKED